MNEEATEKQIVNILLVNVQYIVGISLYVIGFFLVHKKKRVVPYLVPWLFTVSFLLDLPWIRDILPAEYIIMLGLNCFI